MSQKNLLNFLNKLEKELEDSKKYRELISNKQSHRFTINKEGLYDEVIKELELNNILIYEFEKPLVRHACDNYYNNLTKAIRKHLRPITKKESHHLTVKYVNIHRKNELDVIIYAEKGSNTGIFEMIANQKSNEEKILYNFLEPILNRSDTTGTKINKKGEEYRNIGLDITHQGSSAVSSQKVARFGKRIRNYSAVKEHQQWLKDNAIDLNIRKIDKQNIIRISLGSQRFNRHVEGKIDSALRKDLEQKLRNAIEALEVLHLEGSDSLFEGFRKKIARVLESSFKKFKTLRVSFSKKDTQSKTSKSGKVTIRKTPKLIDTGVTELDSLNNFPKPKVARPLWNLRDILNQELHDEVKYNMGSPKLNYRTGRFARSVTVQNVDTVNNIIDYTYMRYPYEVFEYPPKTEGGARLATPMRDPRLVISGSIREIVARHTARYFDLRRI